jgi:DNA repair protein RadC
MKPTMLRDIPPDDRPRERLQKQGAELLTNAELLAILLRTGKKGESALRLAESILADAGGVGRLSTLSVEQLVKNYRLGTVQAITLAAAVELSARIESEKLSKEKFSDSETVKRYLQLRYAGRPQETTGVLLLDARHRLLKDRECYRGTLDRALVEPREILKSALLEDACAIILYHNHPSGDPSPSSEDAEFTRRLKAAADLLSVRLLDHFIIGREGCVSLREAGIL